MPVTLTPDSAVFPSGCCRRRRPPAPTTLTPAADAPTVFRRLSAVRPPAGSGPGLDRPVLERFWDWMSGLPTGDLGTSARGESVADLLSRPFPNTLLLGGLALLLTLVVSVALGC